MNYLEIFLFNKSMRELITKRKFNSELSLKLLSTLPLTDSLEVGTKSSLTQSISKIVFKYATMKTFFLKDVFVC